MVCLSVCLSVTVVSPANTAEEPIEMPFGVWVLWDQVGPRNHVPVLDGVTPHPHAKGQV